MGKFICFQCFARLLFLSNNNCSAWENQFAELGIND